MKQLWNGVSVRCAGAAAESERGTAIWRRPTRAADWTSGSLVCFAVLRERWQLAVAILIKILSYTHDADLKPYSCYFLLAQHNFFMASR